MAPLTDLLIVMRRTLAEWTRVRWNDLHFAAADSTLLVLIVLAALALLLIAARSIRAPRTRRAAVGVPAILSVMRRSPFSSVRHTPFLLFLAGLPFFALALADPLTAFTREQVTYPGRRIALVVDGSNSMTLQFATSRLKANTNRAYFTAVASAERFLQLRMNGPYRDLIALIEFGNNAYVVTPFTTDYENVQLSLRLIGDPVNWARFDDGGTTILEGIAEAAKLFKAFDFANASGNLMVLFSDGEDSEVIAGGKGVSEIVRDAVSAKVPIDFVRTRFDRGFGTVVSDAQWKEAVEGTGGRFYAASNESSLIQAIQDIDRVAAGRIDVKQYVSQRPKYRPFALAAAGIWSVAVLLALAIPVFRSFPA